jgi:hypothetical protein
MDAFNQILFPFALFLIYYGIALWFLHQPILVTENIASPTIKKDDFCSINSEPEINPQAADCKISQEWLETQSLKNLKAIASEFSIEVADRRLKSSYITSILARNVKVMAPKLEIILSAKLTLARKCPATYAGNKAAIVA